MATTHRFIHLLERWTICTERLDSDSYTVFREHATCPECNGAWMQVGRLPSNNLATAAVNLILGKGN